MLSIFPKLSKQFPLPPLLPRSHRAPAPGRRRLLLLPMADPSHSSPAAADSLLAPPPASDAPEAAALPAAAGPDLDAEFGFQRPELGKEKLAGTVGFHQRHVFLCYKSPAEWPSHVEATDSDRLPRILAAAIKARKSNLNKSTKLTICEGEDGTESSLGDVLIFPDMIRYRGLTHFDVDNFVEEVLVKDVEWLPGSPEAIKGSYVFVCAHGSRDKRCGVCGPALITRFKEEIEGQGLDGQVAVSACSHVGGHKYAGNVIIFSSDAKGEVTGHWYGYVAPDDVPVLLHKHIGQGEIVDHLWRRQVCFAKEQQRLRSMTLQFDLNSSHVPETRAAPTSEAVTNSVAPTSKAALPAAGRDLDAEFGFQRPDFMTEALAGTVGFYQRHVFVVHNNIETTGSDSLPRILAAAIKARRPSLKKTIKLSICEGGGPMLSVGDVLIFPDMIRYRGLTHFDVGNFVEEVLVKDVEWLPGSPEAIKGSYVFVCAHGSRDKRCGVCGPALITRFKEEIKGNQVVVSACSHAGGHTLAAHAIIFSSFANGEVAGHWYGYVSPGDVPMLLDKHIGQGEILDHLWRGQLGMTQEEQKKLLELKTRKNGVARQEPSAKEANGTACNGSWQNDVQDEYQNKSVPVEENCKGLTTTTTVEIKLANQHVGTSNDPSLQLAPVMKLKIPDSFNGNAILNVSKLHRFVHARDLQAAVNSCDNWLTSKLSFALIDNGKLFAVQADRVRDYLFQKGAVCVVRKSELQLVVPTKRLYSNSTTLKEHKSEESSLGDMKMVKSEFGGKKWLRRTCSVKGNDDYAILQWRLRNWDDELELEHNAEPEEHQEAIDVDLIKQNKAEKALAQMDAKPKQSNKSIDVDSSRQEKVLPQAGDDFSIKNCIAIASTYKLSVEEMAKAGDIFRFEENRQIFVCFDSVTRLVWLRNQMAQDAKKHCVQLLPD